VRGEAVAAVPGGARVLLGAAYASALAVIEAA
jgi:hypothetical protein